MKHFILPLFLLILLFNIEGCDFQSNPPVYGYVEGDFTYMASQTTGWLHHLTVTRGDSVEKNQLLFVIDPEPELSKFKQAEAELKQAKADLANLKKGKRPTEIRAIEAERDQILAQLNYTKKWSIDTKYSSKKI